MARSPDESDPWAKDDSPKAKWAASGFLVLLGVVVGGAAGALLAWYYSSIRTDLTRLTVSGMLTGGSTALVWLWRYYDRKARSRAGYLDEISSGATENGLVRHGDIRRMTSARWLDATMVWVPLALALIANGAVLVHRDSASRQWPMVEGSVTDVSSPRPGRLTSTRHRNSDADIWTIAYTVNGQKYENDVHFGTDRVKPVLSVIRTVNVHYNPANPDMIAVGTGFPATAWLQVSLGAAWCIVVPVVAWRQRLKEASLVPR